MTSEEKKIQRLEHHIAGLQQTVLDLQEKLFDKDEIKELLSRPQDRTNE